MISRKSLLDHWGFLSDPFESWSTEDEEASGAHRISNETFITPTFFDLVVGDEQHPKSRIVTGDRGSGKSRISAEVERNLGASTPAPLIIRYDDFSDLNTHTAREVDAAYHMLRITEKAAAALINELIASPRGYLDLPGKVRRVLDSYCLIVGGAKARLWKETLDRLTYDSDQGHPLMREMRRAGRAVARYLRQQRTALLKLDAQAGAPAQVARLIALLTPIASEATHLEGETPLGVLRGLADLVRSSGFASAIIIVDRVDEGPALNGRRDLSVSLLRPILCDLPLLEVAGVAFKFFVPPFVLEDLRGIVRTDRIKVEEITWPPGLTQEMISRRLSAFSNATVQSLEDLVTDSDATMASRLIIERSGGFPRDLLRILDRIVTTACTNLDSPSKLNLELVRSGIDRFLAERLAEEDGPAYTERARKFEGYFLTA